MFILRKVCFDFTKRVFENLPQIPQLCEKNAKIMALFGQTRIHKLGRTLHLKSHQNKHQHI